MQNTNIAHPTLVQALWPSAALPKGLKVLLIMLAGSLLLTISAKIQVPFWPVPMTMQTFAVLVIGMACGWRLGAATVALYLGQGALGLPVFAGGGGLAYMAGPTGGYLAGFLVAAALVGFLAERGWDRSVLPTLVAMVFGTFVIFFFGATWLSALIGVEKAVAAGVLPFLAGAVFKIALAAAVLPLAWKLVGRNS